MSQRVLLQNHNTTWEGVYQGKHLHCYCPFYPPPHLSSERKKNPPKTCRLVAKKTTQCNNIVCVCECVREREKKCNLRSKKKKNKRELVAAANPKKQN